MFLSSPLLFLFLSFHSAWCAYACVRACMCVCSVVSHNRGTNDGPLRQRKLGEQNSNCLTNEREIKYRFHRGNALFLGYSDYSLLRKFIWTCYVCLSPLGKINRIDKCVSILIVSNMSCNFWRSKMDRIGEVTISTRFIGFRSNYFGWFTSEFWEFDVSFFWQDQWDRWGKEQCTFRVLYLNYLKFCE